jgi:mycothiol S-conjugate amidase
VTLRLLAVHAHPDDESSKGAGTSASYRARGARVMVVSCTGGERGSILNEKVEARAAAERDIAGLRRLEMARAREIMDIEHRWLGYQDSGMPDEGEALPHGSFASIPLEISAEPLVRIIREYRPQVMVTYDENGGYPHPDHIRTHEVSVYARDAAADPTRYPTAGAAWQIDKLYYERIFNGPRMNALYAALVETDPDNPIIAELADMRRWFERPDLATSHVPIGDFLELRDEALRSHASQVAPDSSFFFWPNELQRSTWPYEDYQLVDSRVHTELPEDDLFTGIATEETA